MRASSYYQPSGKSNAGEHYWRIFVRQAHELIGMGYERMTPSQWKLANEPQITGELVKKIDEALDDPASPSWCSSCSVHEEPPVNDGIKKGKCRLEPDLRIDYSECRPRLRLSYEAKRLGPNHRVSAYLGKDGLGCFVNGQYAADQPAAAMLGYVQCDSESEWEARISASMSESDKQKKLRVRGPAGLTRNPLVLSLSHTFVSQHGRGKTKEDVVIYHSLLRMH